MNIFCFFAKKKNLIYKIRHIFYPENNVIFPIIANYCKFPLTGCLHTVCKNFFAKLVQSVSLCFQTVKFYQNLTTESGGPKQRFSLLQEKAVIQAVCLRTQAVSIKARF